MTWSIRLTETAATLVIVNAFRYFGFDVSGIFRRNALPDRKRETDKR